MEFALIWESAAPSGVYKESRGSKRAWSQLVLSSLYEPSNFVDCCVSFWRWRKDTLELEEGDSRKPCFLQKDDKTKERLLGENQTFMLWTPQSNGCFETPEGSKPVLFLLHLFAYYLGHMNVARC